jgi:hypothetical protein
MLKHVSKILYEANIDSKRAESRKQLDRKNKSFASTRPNTFGSTSRLERDTNKTAERCLRHFANLGNASEEEG